MFSDFEKYIQQQASIDPAEMELIHSKAIEKTLRRRDILVREGDVCRYKIFVTRGLLRAYATRNDGTEHIVHFSPENTWFTEPESFAQATPSIYSIEALENSEVVLWTKNDLGYLLEKIPALNNYFNKLISRGSHTLRQHLLHIVGSTAEEKYEAFKVNNADIFTRVPLHMVASYLGVTRETLSRIRRSHAMGRN